MPKGMQAIYTQKLTSATNAINFNNIPQSYSDLYIVISAMTTSSNDTLRFRINNSTASIYSNSRLTGTGTGTSSDRIVSNGTLFGDYLTTNTSPIPTVTSLYIPNYSTSGFKQIIIDHANEWNSNTAYIQLMSALIRGNFPIESFNIFTGGANLAAGTSATLYGISR